MIFHHHKAIFFHIPKTAGYAIERFLDNVDDRDATVFHPDVLFGIHDSTYTQHLNYTKMQTYVKSDVLDNYFKFTFVRNTWDRLVSAFTYLDGGQGEISDFKKILTRKCHLLKEGGLPITDHYNTQLNYINHNGCQIIDFIGRFENLQDDFAHVCQTLNIPFTDLPKKNSSKRQSDYRYYYDDELINLVHETYKDEIDFFNFKYDP